MVIQIVLFLLHSLISLDNSHSRNLKYIRTVTSFSLCFQVFALQQNFYD